MIMELFEELYYMEEKVSEIKAKQASPFVMFNDNISEEEKVVMKVYQDQIEQLKYELENEHGVSLDTTYELFKQNKQLEVKNEYVNHRLRKLDSKWYSLMVSMEDKTELLNKYIGILSVITISTLVFSILQVLK